MVARRIVVDPKAVSADLEAAFDAARAAQHVPADFPADVLAEAQAASARTPQDYPDATDVPFFTIDPVGSMDLDQAMHLQTDGTGYRVRYAIADVPFFVDPGGAMDRDTRTRGQTIYAPDERTPLHPPVLSEAAASLLPDQVRPAFVWDLRLDSAGLVSSAAVQRALVRSVARLDYDSVQRDIDAGTAEPGLALLKTIGELRMAAELARGGASLPMPEQDVTRQGESYVVTLRPPVPSEEWNAQISLMTGMAGARIMLDGGIGILRTMPPAEQAAIATLRRQARALGVSWPDGQPYGAFLRSLDRTDPAHLAVIHAATSLFRGASYTPFDGAAPAQAEHAAVAAPYAHVTAPLRRLVDRFGLTVCAALSAGDPVPDWAKAALPELPDLMATSDHRAKAVERACIDAVEAAELTGRVGERFAAMVVQVDPKAQVQVIDPPVLAACDGPLELGTRTEVVLTQADIRTGRVRFAAPGAQQQTPPAAAPGAAPSPGAPVDSGQG